MEYIGHSQRAHEMFNNHVHQTYEQLCNFIFIIILSGPKPVNAANTKSWF